MIMALKAWMKQFLITILSSKLKFLDLNSSYNPVALEVKNHITANDKTRNWALTLSKKLKLGAARYADKMQIPANNIISRLIRKKYSVVL